MRRLFLPALLLSGGLVLACSSSSNNSGSDNSGDAGNSGNGSDSGGSISTSVDGSKKLGELTATEAAQVCADAAKSVPAMSADDGKSVACNINALTAVVMAAATQDPAPDAQATCKSTYDDCMAQPADSLPDAVSQDPNQTVDDCSTNLRTSYANCAATVSDYTTCKNDQRPWSLSFAASGLCSKVNTPDDAQSMLTPPTTAACNAINRCAEQ